MNAALVRLRERIEELGGADVHATVPLELSRNVPAGHGVVVLDWD